LFCILQVLKHLAEENRVIRIVGLSATPGTNIDAVTEVIQNLSISKLEFRTDESPDVAKYTNKKDVECIPVKLTNSILEIRTQFLKVSVFHNLIILHLTHNKNVTVYLYFFILYGS